jgi:hypothetical protein
MPLWLLAVLVAIAGALLHTVVQMRSQAPMQVRVLVLTAAWLMVPLLFVVFRIAEPELGAITIF